MFCSYPFFVVSNLKGHVMFHFKSILLCCVFVVIGTACSSPHKSKIKKDDDLSVSDLTISGAVIYHGSSLEVENAQLIIELEDTSKQGLVTLAIAKQVIQLRSAPPWSFTLTYDPKKLEKSGRYVLRARVEVGGQLRLINDSNILAFNTPEPINIIVSAITR